MRYRRTKSNLLDANHDTPTVQELLEHSDTKTVRSRTRLGRLDRRSDPVASVIAKMPMLRRSATAAGPRLGIGNWPGFAFGESFLIPTTADDEHYRDDP